MKICLTVNSSPWSAFKGGGQLAVHHLARALSAKGHEVRALYSKRPHEEFDAEIPYKAHWAFHHDFETVNFNFLSYSRELRLLIKAEKFDVIHGNAEEAYHFGPIARLNGAAYVFTSHAPNIPVAGMLKGMLRPIQFLKSVNTYLLRQAMAEADRIVAFSEFSRNLIVKGLGETSAEKVRVIPPGVESSWSKVERNQVDPNRILFWGRIEEEKGLPELFAAFKTVAQKFADVKLTVAGEGGRLREYKSRVADLGLTRHVEFVGWLSNMEIQNLVTKSCLGVFPSRVESFGLSVVEAMAAGLPVVAARGGAIPENIEEEVTGKLVPVNQPEALAEAILLTLEDRKSSENRAELAKSAIKQKFSWEKAAETTIRLYDEILGK